MTIDEEISSYKKFMDYYYKGTITAATSAQKNAYLSMYDSYKEKYLAAKKKKEEVVLFEGTMTATEVLPDWTTKIANIDSTYDQLKEYEEEQEMTKKKKEAEELKDTKLTDPLRYDTYEDVSMRLHNSIVRYKGHPVQVSVCEGLWVNVLRLDKPKHPKYFEKVHSSDVELDVSSPPLGYMNHDKQTYYVQRCPHRKQKQGFCNKTAIIFHEPVPAAFDVGYDPYKLMWEECMYNTIMGIYPSGLTALEKVSKGEVVCIGFSRRFALVKDDLGIIKLKHMTRSVGWFKPDSDVLIIPDAYMNPIFEKELGKEGFNIKS